MTTLKQYATPNIKAGNIEVKGRPIIINIKKIAMIKQKSFDVF